MKTLKLILGNESGHGMAIEPKDLLKIGAVILTFPISIPILIIRDKIKKRKKKR